MTKARDLASGNPAPSTVSTTELGYVDGVTSAIQTQMDSKLATATAASTYQTKAAAGLVLINTTSFSGVASQSLTSVFSSTYNAYRIVLTISSFASGGQVNYRYGTSGTPQTAANYSYAGIYGDNNNTTGAFGSSGQTSILWGQSSSSGNEAWFGVVDIGLPNGANRTFSTHSAATNGATRSTFQGGAYNGADQFTDFVILPNANMTGSVSVYGYNK